MDCSTQEALSMRLDHFCKYYEDFASGSDRRLLNVISLEFSHTHLDPLVEAPRVVRNGGGAREIEGRGHKRQWF